MNKKKNLLVEDEQDLGVVRDMVLEDGGYEVDSFTEPVLALKNFKAGFYDLVIIEIKMPEMDPFNVVLCLGIQKLR
jgi:CheY-like chemotaxis protein